MVDRDCATLIHVAHCEHALPVTQVLFLSNTLRRLKHRVLRIRNCAMQFFYQFLRAIVLSVGGSARGFRLLVDLPYHSQVIETLLFIQG